jgi:chemotaxis protein CheZ
MPLLPDRGNPTKLQHLLPAFATPSSPAEVMRELEKLSILIKTMKKEISQIHNSQLLNYHIPTAHDELDAVIDATAQATHAILQATEDIEAYTKHLPEKIKKTMQGYTVKIYEACTFQDITGQRINKVISTLKIVEQHIAHLLEVAALDQKERQEKEAIEASLLNGPQPTQKAPTQQEIDAIFEKD